MICNNNFDNYEIPAEVYVYRCFYAISFKKSKMSTSEITEIICYLNNVFKCCKMKLFKQYMCINYFSVYNRSCIKRYSKQITYLEGNLITCCRTPEKLQNDVSLLEETITNLTEDIIHKDKK